MYEILVNLRYDTSGHALRIDALFEDQATFQ